MKQLLLKLPDNLIKWLDEKVRKGGYESRQVVIREILRKELERIDSHEAR